MSTKKRFLVACALSLVMSCAKDVSITMVAPASLAGAAVTVDNQPAATFETYGESNSTSTTLVQSGTIVRFEMDVGVHTVRIVDRERVLTFKLQYDKPTEDHLVLDRAMLLKLEATDASRPPFLDDLE
jgi:hypothetical protein